MRDRYRAEGPASSREPSRTLAPIEPSRVSRPTLTVGEALWRFKFSFLIVVALCVAAGYAYTQSQDRVYTSEARLLLSPPSSGLFATGNDQEAERHLRNEVERMRSATVRNGALDRIADAVESDPVLSAEAQEIGDRYAPTNLVEIAKRVAVTGALDLDLIEVSATGPTAQMAALTANAVVDTYTDLVNRQAQARAERLDGELRAFEDEVASELRSVESQISAIRTTVLEEIQAEPPSIPPVDVFLELDRRLGTNPLFDSLERQRNSLLSELTSVQARIREVNVDQQVFAAGVDLLEEAPVPGRPSGPRATVNLLVAALLGAILGLALVAFRASRFDRVLGQVMVEELTGVHHLVDVPRIFKPYHSAVPVTHRPRSLAADAMQGLAGATSLKMDDLDAKTLVVSSARPRDGKTLIALNLALALGSDGRRVALIDADDRARALTQLVGFDPAVGLQQVAGSEDGEDVLELRRRLPLPDDADVGFYPSGAVGSETQAFLRTERFSHALEVIAADNDIVIIDAPPLTSSAVTSMAPSIDALLLVVRNGAHAAHLERAADRMQVLDIPVLGFVRNRVHAGEAVSRTQRPSALKGSRPSIARGMGKHQTFRPWSVRTTGRR